MMHITMRKSTVSFIDDAERVPEECSAGLCPGSTLTMRVHLGGVSSGPQPLDERSFTTLRALLSAVRRVLRPALDDKVCHH
jgi:hypothetical protein